MNIEYWDGDCNPPRRSGPCLRTRDRHRAAHHPGRAVHRRPRAAGVQILKRQAVTRTGRGEAGFTLIEMLLTMTIASASSSARWSAAIFLGLRDRARRPDAPRREQRRQLVDELLRPRRAAERRSIVATNTTESAVVCGAAAGPSRCSSRQCRRDSSVSYFVDPRNPKIASASHVRRRRGDRPPAGVPVVRNLAGDLRRSPARRSPTARAGSRSRRRDPDVGGKNPYTTTVTGIEEGPMTRHLPSYRRARGEEGVALGVGARVPGARRHRGVLRPRVRQTRASARPHGSRTSASALYAVDGAVNNAIRYVQNTRRLGGAGNTSCAQHGQRPQQPVDVTSSAPPTPQWHRRRHRASAAVRDPDAGAVHALLGHTRLHGGTSYPGARASPPQRRRARHRAGAEQKPLTRHRQRLRQLRRRRRHLERAAARNISAAQRIQVNGDVRRAGVAATTSSSPPATLTPPYGWYCDQNGRPTTTTQRTPAAPRPAVRPPRPPPRANLADPAIANATSWAPAFTGAPPTQTVPTCPAGSLVTFSPVPTPTPPGSRT